MVDPERQDSRSREDGYQPGAPDESLSMGGLIQNCAAALENEGTNLLRDGEQKTSALDELKRKILRQSENISKQRAELEHLKALSQREIMNRESCNTKNSAVREKGEVLKSYFSSLCKNINLLLLSKEQLNQFMQQELIREDDNQIIFGEIDKQFSNALVEAQTYIQGLETMSDRELSEFSEIKGYLINECRLQEQQENELENNLRELQGNHREKVTMVNMLTPQNTEFKVALEKIKLEITADMKEVECTTTQLQTVLQNELERKENFTGNIDAMEKMIYETNNNIINKEESNQEFDSKQKHLIAKEETYTKTMENEMENLNNFHSKVEMMKEQFCILLKVDEENSTLKLESENMEEVAESIKVKINETEQTELSYAKEIEKTEKSIEEKESEKSKKLTEKQITEESIRELEKEMKDDEIQHELQSKEIDKPYIELTVKSESINESLNLLSEQLKQISDDKMKLDNTIERLGVEEEKAIAISEESDSKLFSQYEEFSRIHADLKEQEGNLDDMIAKSVQDYTKAQNDIQLSENIKIDVKGLEAELENEKVSFQSLMDNRQESHKSQIQSKNQEMADCRIYYEREFRNKEQSKTDALMEAKENKARINDLIKQKSLTEDELKKTQSNVEKCERLVRKLENKLKRVARVATEESNSQLFGIRQYQSSQSTNLLDSTPLSTSRRTKQSNFPSPTGSQSSAMTFDPDSVDMMKVKRKNVTQKKLQKSFQPKKSLKENQQEIVQVINSDWADWGF